MTHHVFDMPVTDEQVRALKVGDTVTLEQTLFGIRDATLIAMFDGGRSTRFNLKGHAVVHTAPNVRKVDPRPGNSSGYEPLCIGTTTSMRMERFTKALMEREGVKLIIGKVGMGQATLDAFRDLGGAYLAVVGGAAALETTWIEAIEEVDMDDLHPESLWKFRIKGFGPLLVTMDSHGASLRAQVNAEAAARRAAVLASIGSARTCKLSPPTFSSSVPVAPACSQPCTPRRPIPSSTSPSRSRGCSANAAAPAWYRAATTSRCHPAIRSSGISWTRSRAAAGSTIRTSPGCW